MKPRIFTRVKWGDKLEGDVPKTCPYNEKGICTINDFRSGLPMECGYPPEVPSKCPLWTNKVIFETWVHEF